MAKIDIVSHKKCKFIFINDDLWMWDTFRERELQKRLAKDAFGDVLVAGYGFGLVSKYLTQNPKVNSVTTVEKYPEIINALKKNGKLYGNIVIKDF